MQKNHEKIVSTLKNAVKPSALVTFLTTKTKQLTPTTLSSKDLFQITVCRGFSLLPAGTKAAWHGGGISQRRHSPWKSRQEATSSKPAFLLPFIVQSGCKHIEWCHLHPWQGTHNAKWILLSHTLLQNLSRMIQPFPQNSTYKHMRL